MIVWRSARWVGRSPKQRESRLLKVIQKESKRVKAMIQRLVGAPSAWAGLMSQEYAPTTLPSHLLALLTAPSPRAIIIVMEEFDLFTEHARQALLYCLRESFPFAAVEG
jgi:hypothetical protein